jgi:hypothetical protein
MSEKDFLKDGMGNDEIVKVIKEIIEKKKLDENKRLGELERYEKLKNEFEFFSTRYPMLFDLSVRDGDFDWNSLNYFLSMRAKIIEDKMTSENASIKVGKEWFDKHIDTSRLHKNKKHRK